ncbi:MAG: UBA/THIF-type binding fold protein, partial [Aeromicrobium sp.]|nr:UBA/THIF-type binding fold protein [Aeromicrobium sp.]
FDVRDDHADVTNVPFVNTERQVCRGTMVIGLTTSGEQTDAPPDHTVMFAGSMPCHADGTPIERIVADHTQREIAPGLTIDHRFSSKPTSGKYDDYHHQFVSYIQILAHEAQAIAPTATARTHAPVETEESESVFVYLDSASSRAGIKTAMAKLQVGKVAIVGLGGTGSYVLDLLAKTPIGEIHLFDGDVLLNHNAYRAPGAVSLDALRARPSKVDYYASLYRCFRRGIVAHGSNVTAANAHDLDVMDFVFLCMDGGADKRAIVDRLEHAGVSFIDVGMGIYEQEASLGGVLRVTTSTPQQRDHVRDFGRIAFEGDEAVDEYARNIQIADLNSLNASMAVIRWKKLAGFYLDFDHEHYSTYTIDGNHLLNEDRA